MKDMLDIKRRITFVTVFFLAIIFSEIAHSEVVSGYVIKIKQSASLEFRLNYNSNFYLGFIDDELISRGSEAEYFHSNGGMFFSDANCKLGHSVQIRFENKKNQYQYIYLENELIWDQPVHVLMSFERGSKSVKLKINEEEIAFEPKSRPTYFYVSSKNKNINLTSSAPKIYVKDNQ